MELRKELRHLNELKLATTGDWHSGQRDGKTSTAPTRHGTRQPGRGCTGQCLSELSLAEPDSHMETHTCSHLLQICHIPGI